MVLQLTLDVFNEAKEQNLPTTAEYIGVGIDGPSGSVQGFSVYLGSIIQAVLSIGALILLFYIILGGIEWISAAGDSGKIQKARDKIVQGIVGMIVLSASLAIFSLVRTFVGLDEIGRGDAGVTIQGSGRPTSPGMPTGDNKLPVGANGTSIRDSIRDALGI